MQNDKDFPAGSIAEVVKKADEYTEVSVGARGIVREVEGKEVYATWVLGSESNEGFIYKENLRIWKPPAPPMTKDIRQFLANLARTLEVKFKHRTPSSNAKMMLELGKSWQGSTQGLYEMIMWIDQSPEVWEAIRYLGADWIGGFKKEDEVEEVKPAKK
jgi:hypothetical protein